MACNWLNELYSEKEQEQAEAKLHEEMTQPFPWEEVTKLTSQELIKHMKDDILTLLKEAFTTTDAERIRQINFTVRWLRTEIEALQAGIDAAN